MKHKFQSVSVVEQSEEENEGLLVGLLTPKYLKTEPAPQAQDQVFSGNGAWPHWPSVLLVDLEYFRVLWQVLV